MVGRNADARQPLNARATTAVAPVLVSRAPWHHTSPSSGSETWFNDERLCVCCLRRRDQTLAERTQGGHGRACLYPTLSTRRRALETGRLWPLTVEEGPPTPLSARRRPVAAMMMMMMMMRFPRGSYRFNKLLAVPG